MNKILFAVLASASVALPVMAAEIPVKIESVSKSSQKILVTSSQLGSLKKGDLVSLNDDCTLEVTKRTKRKAVLKSELCENKSSLKKNRIVRLTSDDSISSMDENDDYDAELDEVRESEGQTTTSSRSSRSNRKSLYSGKIAEGMRLSFRQASLDGELSLGSSSANYNNVDYGFGLSVGGVSINQNSIGYIADITYISYDEDVDGWRLEGSGTYGFSNIVYMFGGLNISAIYLGSEEIADPELGLQLGVGFQVNPKFGINLAYVDYGSSRVIGGNEIKLEFSGLELSLHGTF